MTDSQPEPTPMVVIPSGQLAVVIEIHDNNDCTYRLGNGQTVRLAHYSMMEKVEEQT